MLPFRVYIAGAIYLFRYFNRMPKMYPSGWIVCLVGGHGLGVTGNQRPVTSGTTCLAAGGRLHSPVPCPRSFEAQSFTNTNGDSRLAWLHLTFGIIAAHFIYAQVPRHTFDLTSMRLEVLPESFETLDHRLLALALDKNARPQDSTASLNPRSLPVWFLTQVCSDICMIMDDKVNPSRFRFVSAV